MRGFKRSLCLLLAGVLLSGLLPVQAEEVTEETDFFSSTWEELTAEFLQSRNINPEHVAIGYRNTVTGEEHCLNGDKYMSSGSMYKVALNMYWSEKIYEGEESWDKPVWNITYADAQKASLIDSNNDISSALFDAIGGYAEYRRQTARFYGLSPDTAGADYLKSNDTTPQQMLYCLGLLCSQPERYPGVLDCMLQAEPEEYFRRDEKRFPIAQKYGYLDGPNFVHVNSCGIVYTDEPFLLVVYTFNVSHGEQFLSDYCTFLCDYTQARTAAREEKLASVRARQRQVSGEPPRRGALLRTEPLPSPDK